MHKTLIIYETRYGFTATVAANLALVLGPARYCRPVEFEYNFRDFDFFVIGSPIYGGQIDKRIHDFVFLNRDWLKDKHIALFCTCLMADEGKSCLEPLREMLGDSAVWAEVILGQLSLSKLNAEDYNSLQDFCNRVGFPFQDHNMFDIETLVGQALRLKAVKDSPLQPMPREDLKHAVEDFLNSHNTCALCSGFKTRVRSTPIEYTYRDGYMYILSEGGEKFANLLLNSNVSVSIYDPYEGMENLGGMQIWGKAAIVERGSEEYKSILEIKSLNYGETDALPFYLNAIKVRLDRAEFLWSRFESMGYDTKQIYYF